MPEKAPHTVTVVTGTRADYGILRPVLTAIAAQPSLRLQVLITGMHLLKKFGHTAREVAADGWPICGEVPLQTEQDDPASQAVGLGQAISGMASLYAQTRTDIVLVLGDRLEIFAAAAASSAADLVLAHIHGGDVAPGIQDDAYRHAISKLAHIHFAATRGAVARLIRMGEERQRIHLTGSPAIDDLNTCVCKDLNLLSQRAGFDVAAPYLLVMQHPAGGTDQEEYQRMVHTLAACRSTGLPLLIIYPNCDCGYAGIVRAIDEVRPLPGCHIFEHIPRDLFLGYLKHCRVLVGNSSCGMIEAGRFPIDILDIGPRQLKRERSRHAAHCDYNQPAILALLEKFLKSNRLRRSPCRIYGTGGSGFRIASILGQLNLSPEIRRKLITY